jgi:hypothetical protein
MMSPVQTTSLTWPDLLALATTPEEVIGVARDFLATWSPQELNRLPASCKPPDKFADPEEIVLYAFALVDQQVHSGTDHPGVFRMASFFSEATRRVTQLMGHIEEPAANAPALRH